MFRHPAYVILPLILIFAFALSLALYRMLPVPYWILFADGIIHAGTFTGIAFLIRVILKNGNYSALSVFQRIINYAAIGLLGIGIWLGISYGLFYLTAGEKYSLIVANSIRIKGFLGIWMYLLLIHYCYHHDSESEQSTEPEFTITDERADVSGINISENELLERIAVKNGQKIQVIPVSEIIHIQADGDYVKIHTATGKFLKEETMKYFQENLPPKKFVRIHRSYIVNVEMISRIEIYEKQNQLITLKNGEQIKASATGYKQLKSVLNL